MLFRLLGIGRCPYIPECGPDTGENFWPNDAHDDAMGKRTCYTFAHRKCPNYLAHQAQQERRTERATMESLDGD